MKFRDGDAGWLAAYLLAAGFFIYAVLHFPTVHEFACDSGDTNCLREWMSALSGWFGAIAAFGTIIFVIRQIDEQKRQTDFILGDATPTVDVTPDLDDPSEMVVRIVNWNRRGIILRAIATNVGDEMGIIEVKHNGNVVPPGSLRWPFPIHGWENRNQEGPQVLQLKISGVQDGKLLRDWPSNAHVKVTLHVLGDRHQIKKLVAAVHP